MVHETSTGVQEVEYGGKRAVERAKKADWEERYDNLNTIEGEESIQIIANGITRKKKDE